MYGFGDSIRKWIRLFFDKREALILLGGHLSKKIILEQGVPQGDLISPYIFLLCVEILALKIKFTKNLTGVIFAKKEARLKNLLMCQDLNLKWMDSFTVLGITIDNRLQELQNNFQRIFDKVAKKIGFWIRYGLTLKGRITVAKSLLLSQYTYVATILDSNVKK